MKKKNNVELNYLINNLKNRFKKSQYKINDLKIYKVISRKGINFLCAFTDINFKRKFQKSFRRLCLVVPESVVIVPILIYKNKKFTMMISQQRVDDGSPSLEFPAGAIHFKDTPKKSAKNEINEELKLDIKTNDIKKLTDKVIRIDPSMTTHRAHFFYFIKKVEKDFFRAYHNLDSGDKTLGENLKIKILSFKEVKKINTSSAIIGLKLLENKFLNFK